MTTIEESDQIAARLAAASQVFRIRKPDDFESRVDVSAEGNVLTVVVTDHLGRAKREYRAVLGCVSNQSG